MIRAMIVDDELPAREELRYLLEKHKDIEIIEEAKNGLEALNIIKENILDVIFLDINMPKISGIEVASEVLNYKIEKVPLIVFITAYDDYAIKAFELNAIDYLLKPIGDKRLNKALNKLRESLNNKGIQYEKRLSGLIKEIQGNKEYKYQKLTLYKDGMLFPIELKNIIMATVEDKNTTIITTTGKFIYHETLTHLEERINRGNFYRSHRSFLINIDYIEKIEPWFNNTFHIKLKGYDEMIPVSRGQVKEFKMIMNII
ncbi:response regulator transcription factor [Clostridium sp. D2Q-11]|uniref:Response regulator transcription factor n=1 Tax=Anaeromonas frigoriresistens TaxID=2683708 RepID=A0A942UUP4_9FIRM|nr:LytTR family DNA-binding domain-containing protein [Anaeromonas frigoriresistens]MBS4537820.1 response regulator transcription factor [Anaeromonas frigoriresistens]